MKRVTIKEKNRLVLENIKGFIVREVVPVGNSAKVPCPKEDLGRRVYLVITDDKNEYIILERKLMIIG